MAASAVGRPVTSAVGWAVHVAWAGAALSAAGVSVVTGTAAVRLASANVYWLCESDCGLKCGADGLLE